jgi:hypothetical protein
VRTVVAGGRPTYGPMQAPSGTRGAVAYNSYSLDDDMTFAGWLDANSRTQLPDRFQDTWLTYAGFNLRDSVRKGSDVALQFVYEAADCRIFYTPETFNDYGNLWRRAVDAAWNKPEYCVKDSTGFATTGSDTNLHGPPAQYATKKPNMATKRKLVRRRSHAARLKSSPPAEKVGDDTTISLISKRLPAFYATKNLQLGDHCSYENSLCGPGLLCKPLEVCPQDAVCCDLAQISSQPRCVQSCWTDSSKGGGVSRCQQRVKGVSIQCQSVPSQSLKDKCRQVKPDKAPSPPYAVVKPQPTPPLVWRCSSLCIPPQPKACPKRDATAPYGGNPRLQNHA